MLTQCCETNGHIGDLQLGIYTNNLKNNGNKPYFTHSSWCMELQLSFPTSLRLEVPHRLGNIESDRLHKLIHPGEDGNIRACARATASSLACVRNRFSKATRLGVSYTEHLFLTLRVVTGKLSNRSLKTKEMNYSKGLQLKNTDNHFQESEQNSPSSSVLSRRGEDSQPDTFVRSFSTNFTSFKLICLPLFFERLLLLNGVTGKELCIKGNWQWIHQRR